MYNTQIYNSELLNPSQIKYIAFLAKGMAEMWSRITIVWYSDGKLYYQITGIGGQIYPTIQLD